MFDVNEHIVKFMGKANIPEAPELGHGYTVLVEAVIDDPQYINNEDGTYDAIYKIKPIRAELQSDRGMSIKTKDTRKMSQKVRALHYRFWESNPKDVPDSEEAYNRTMKWILMNMEQIYDMARNDKHL